MRRCVRGRARDEHRGHQPPRRRAAAAHVAIGTFDGVHLGHRAVIEGADTVLTFDPHPLEVIHPEAAAEADHAVRGQARRDRGPRRPGARRDPLRPGVRRVEAEEFIEHVLVEKLGAERSPSARTSASARRPRATPEMLASRSEFETEGRAAGRGRRRDRLLDPDPRPARGRRDGGRAALPRRPVHDRGRGRQRRSPRPHARLPDREHRSRRRAS